MKNKKPRNKTSKIVLSVEMIIWLIALGLIVLSFLSGPVFGSDSFIAKIFGSTSGDELITSWDKLIESLPTLIKALVASFIVFAVERFIRFLIRKGMNKSKRRETIAKLSDNLIKYLSAIVIIFILLAAFGVDTSTLLASAGILGIVLGLGAQSLISDIIAGMFIVFDNEYQVGDIILVDGWRGTVKEVGIRTTKIEDASGNMKVINNSSVTTVVNLSHDYSYASTVVGIEYSESLERVEAVLSKELPKAKEKIPAIVEGPFYKGVKTLNTSSVDLFFVAKCKEEDIYQVERDMNREIKLIFDANDINIPFPQVVVNEPKEPKGNASEKTKKIAKEFIENQKDASKGIEEQD
ncbi:MAG: mechanosensitive ion channel family protein [Bacillales bacterium]|nr:mechanosensitive ion channel family protein [Bacillales bacterium]